MTHRWRSFLSMGDDAVVDVLLTRFEALRDLGFESAKHIGKMACLAPTEVGASPFGLIAVALGVGAGATHIHRELITLPVFEEAQTRDERHGTWAGGALQTGKYQAFLQEGAHAIFDPSHIAKWGPHEMMHRACGYYFCANDLPFERYLAARLGELLPVALWYGFDQVARLDETRFVRHKSQKEVTRAPFWEESTEAFRERLRRGLPEFRWGLSYVDSELELIRQEGETRRLRESKTEIGAATLNGSSDALAYEVAHGHRLRTPTVCDVLSRFEHSDSVGSFLNKVESRLDALLFEPIETLLGALAGTASARSERDEHHGALFSAFFHAENSEAQSADGLTGLDFGQLAEGVELAAPEAFNLIEAEVEDWLERFVNSEQFWIRAPLVERVLRFVEKSTFPASVRDEFALDAAAQRLCRDRFADHLAPPSDLALSGRLEVGASGGSFRLTSAFTMVRCAHSDVLVTVGQAQAVLSVPVGAEVSGFLRASSPGDSFEASSLIGQLGQDAFSLLCECGVLFRAE